MGHVVYKGIYFEWDDLKKKRNPIKHDGVTFEDAMEVFLDPGVRFIDASRSQELRSGAIGYGSANRILYVVSVEIEDDGFRLIGARRATANERQYYEGE